MFAQVIDVYRKTRKKNDLVFNHYVMRPIAAVVVAALGNTSVTPNQLTFFNLAVFALAAAIFALVPTFAGGLIAVGVLELSYCFDCADGMLARHKGMASKIGHLFDFFTDEAKALLLVSSLSVRLFRTGGHGPDLSEWRPGTVGFLLAGIVGSVVVASACSLTNFVRRPELSGREQSVEAHYEAVREERPKSLVGAIAALVTTFLRFLNHYPSHLFLFALASRLDAFFWMYVALNLLYLGRGWLGLVLRLGRFEKPRPAAEQAAVQPSGV